MGRDVGWGAGVRSEWMDMDIVEGPEVDTFTSNSAELPCWSWSHFSCQEDSGQARILSCRVSQVTPLDQTEWAILTYPLEPVDDNV